MEDCGHRHRARGPTMRFEGYGCMCELEDTTLHWAEYQFSKETEIGLNTNDVVWLFTKLAHLIL